MPKKQQIVRSLAGGLVLFWVFAAGVMYGRGSFSLGSVSNNSKLPDNLNYASVEQTYDILRSRYDGRLDQNTLLDGLKEGLARASGDPYTEYMNPKDANSFNEGFTGSFTGIGAVLGKNEQGNVIVVSPIDGFPAKQAGLLPKDVIAEVNGEDASAWTVDKAVDKIRGPKDTVVKLKIVRSGAVIDVEITRDTITIPSVESKILDGNIGYLKITQFGDDTVELAQQAAKSFKEKAVTGVVLDLRGNPGGYLEGAVDVSSLWLQNSTVLKEKRDGKLMRTYNARGIATLSGVKTVVLIDEGSASASEITAGALRDNNAAKLVGVKSFGKGSVQEIQKLPNGGILKVTIARWFTPKDKNIDKEGILPDKEVKLSSEDIKNAKDPQLDAAKLEITE